MGREERCRWCRWWGVLEQRHAGICGHEEMRVLVWVPSKFPALVTREDFGCVLWECKEEKDEG
jgi:hypothetical protein